MIRGDRSGVKLSRECRDPNIWYSELVLPHYHESISGEIGTMAWSILEDPMAQLMAEIEEGNREIHRCMDSMQSAMERMEITVKGLLTDPSDCQRWRPGTGAKEDKVTQKTIEVLRRVWRTRPTRCSQKSLRMDRRRGSEPQIQSRGGTPGRSRSEFGRSSSTPNFSCPCNSSHRQGLGSSGLVAALTIISSAGTTPLWRATMRQGRWHTKTPRSWGCCSTISELAWPWRQLL
jgi:hypothetical protein